MFERRGEAKTMKKAILLLLSVGLIAGAAVSCGGDDVRKEVRDIDNMSLSDGFYDDDYTEGDFFTNNNFNNTGDDSDIDWGSDITFDDINIILPDFDEPCYIDIIESILATLDIPADKGVRADRFTTWEDNADGYFISYDGSFAFRIDENTEIVLEDGVEFIGDEFDGRYIIVIYDVSTRSIPEMTTAIKLIVLYESIIPVRL